jgi:tRNA(Arg) A34 adenosine deaminase TadA
MTIPALQVNQAFIKRTIELAASAVAHGNHPFGALLVKNGQIILEAENTIFTEHDVTNHAEMNLVRLAVKHHEADFLADCILYTSTEPCAMCSGAIYWAGIGGVVYACSAGRLADFAGEHLGIRSAEIFATGVRKVSTVGPILETEAEGVHRTYWK